MELLIQDLTKNYGEKTALNGVSLRLSDGIYGLLGPNGAGKSTLMNILTGNLSATRGQITLDGQEIGAMGTAYRAHLGYQPQQQAFYPTFTAEQFLFYIASLRRMKKAKAAQRIDFLLGELDLSAVRHQPIRSFSGGMRQRLLLAQALLDDPDIMVLDEPTAGLDPKQRIMVRNLISQLAEHKIILISTHVVSDVSYIAKELILISQGELISQGSFAQLTEPLQNRVREVQVGESQIPELETYGQICGVARTAHGVQVRMICDSVPPYPSVAAAPTMEDVYLHCFGEMG